MSNPGPDWWQTISPMLDEALDLPEPARREWIASLSARDPALARQIESLLDEHDTLSRSGFLERGPTPHAFAGVTTGTMVGAYTLVAPIGEGGMGSVWLGERRDGEIQQRVAIKVVGFGGHRPSWRGRFLRERQLLSSLDHPAIVRVIDAGHTEQGLPYLVMEYIEGSPIDVAAALLPIDDRLRLFAEVCDAVWYAHRHLVIHRDLKPSNILVDRAGRPKLLDFGIARLLEDSLETVEATQTVDRLLTPGYASPEQLRGAPQTTATDVYSLGAVLYKLLTGQAMHEGVKPVRKLNPSLPADADYVLRKALRAEPEERYASVDALARDVRALADRRPVEARAGDVWYRTRKLARRYWLPAVATCVVVGALSVGLYVADRARATADRRFDQLRRLAAQVLTLDKSLRALAGSEQARHQLVSMMSSYLEGLQADVHGDVGLMQELAEAYTRMAEVQGVPDSLNLGEQKQADASLVKADTLIEAVLRSKPTDRTALLDAATIAEERMILADTNHRDRDELALARKAADRLQRLQRVGPPQDPRALATAYGNVALGFLNLHHYDEAVPLARAGAAAARSDRAAGFVLGENLSLLASALRYEGHLDEALRAIDEADAASRQAVYPSNEVKLFNQYGVLMRKASILGDQDGISLDRPLDAARVYQAALDSMESLVKQTDPGEATSRSRAATAGRALGDVLRDRDPARALAAYDLALARLRETRSSLARQRDEALTLASSAHALRRLGRVAEGRRRIAAAVAILTATKDLPATRIPLDSSVGTVLREEADQQAYERQDEPAARTYERLIAAAYASGANPAGDLRDAAALSRLYQRLKEVYRSEHAFDRADAQTQKQLDLWRPWAGRLPGNPFIAREMAAVRAR